MPALVERDAVLTSVLPSSSLKSHVSVPATPSSLLSRRANAVVIPTLYDTGGAPPGTVVAALLGSVAGFIALVWLFWAVQGNLGGKAVSEEVVRREPSHRSRRDSYTESHRRSHHEHHNHRDRSEPHRRSRSKSQRGEDRGRIIREETIVPIGTREVVREKREIRQVREVPATAVPTTARKYYDLSPRADEVVEVYEEEATVVERAKDRDDRKKDEKKRHNRHSRS